MHQLKIMAGCIWKQNVRFVPQRRLKLVLSLTGACKRLCAPWALLPFPFPLRLWRHRWRPESLPQENPRKLLVFPYSFLEQLSPTAHDMLKLLESLGCGWSVVKARLLASKNILLQRPGSLSCYPFYLAHFKWDVHSLVYPEVYIYQQVKWFLLLVYFYKIWGKIS